MKLLSSILPVSEAGHVTAEELTLCPSSPAAPKGPIGPGSPWKITPNKLGDDLPPCSPTRLDL